MADPFRLRVLKALTDIVKGAPLSNAQKTVEPDTGPTSSLADFTEAGVSRSRVFRGRQQFGDGDPLPMVSILEHPRALDVLDEPGGGPGVVVEWDLLIQGFVVDDPQNPTDPAHHLVADVISILTKERRRKAADGRTPDILGLGSAAPCVTKIAIGSPVVRPADGLNSSQAFFWLTVTLTLAENTENPFL